MGRKLNAKDMKDALRRLYFSTSAPTQLCFMRPTRAHTKPTKKLLFRNVRHLDSLKLGCQAQETLTGGEAVLVLAKFKQEQQPLTSKAKCEAGSHLVHLVTSPPSYLHTKNYLCVTISENAKLAGILQPRPSGDM